jgi:hypothetical protein
MQTISVRYCFTYNKGCEEVFDLVIDAHDLSLLTDIPEVLPAWTELGFHQCPHCPLNTSEHLRCPLAAHLVGVVSSFEDLVSYDMIQLTVVTQERTVCQETTAQRAISSLMGLISATSGCPHTVFFRPMARYHLPLASEDETIYRATSMYLLAQYFKRKEGHDPDIEFLGLKELYKKIEIVNQNIAKRLKAATETDSTVNAIIFLDLYAKAVPFVIEDSLEDIRHLFKHFFTDDPGAENKK